MKNLLSYAFVLSFLIIAACKQSAPGTEFVAESTPMPKAILMRLSPMILQA